MTGRTATEPRRTTVVPVVVVVALLFAAIAFPHPASAQADRPKIGLALAGGGAKGGAHVGVLKVLEELRIPIDYVAGTSMGAIIGGLYVAGLSPQDLEREIAAIDWDDVLEDNTNRLDLSFRRKEDDARYLVPFQAGLGRGGLKWPAGLIQGQKLYFLLQRLTLPVADVQSFDDLPTPFRCVATDIQTGEMVVLDGGSLAMALRASMAIPTVFSPVTYDGRLLVDGGLTRNLPIDVVREMGADVVIAVDLGAPLEDEEVETLMQILSQTMRLLTRVNVEDQLPSADIVLNPAVARFGTMDFARIDQIVRLGEDEARSRADDLAELSLDPEAYARHLAARPQARHPATAIGSVRFEGNERVDDRIIGRLLGVEAGDPLDLDSISDDLGRIYGLGDFESASFVLEGSETEPDLELRLVEKSWGPNYVHFGFELQADFSGDTSVGLLVNVTPTRLNKLGGEWRNDLEIGTDSRLFSEFYQPLDFSGRWFLSPRISYEIDRVPFFEDGREVAQLKGRSALVGFDLGHQFSKFGEVRIGVQRGRLDVSVDSGVLPDEAAQTLLGDDIDLGEFRFRAAVDRLDSVTFPKRGGALKVEALVSSESLGADEEFTRWEARGAVFGTLARRHTLFGTVQGGWSPGSDLPLYREFFVGGLFSLSGFSRFELRGQSFGVARAGYYREISAIHVGAFLEAGNVWTSSEDADFDSLLGTGTLFLGKQTALGPLYLAYGLAEGGSDSFYLALGIVP